MKYSIISEYDRVLKFIKEHPGDFDDYEIQFLLDYVKLGVADDKMVPDLVREVFDELGLIYNKNNIYLGFLDMLQKEFPVEDRKIVEVGGGIIPSLAKRISKIQTTGNIVVYDPRLSKYEKDTDKLKLKREKFEVETDVSDRNLIIGFMPCEAAVKLIESATKNRIDFMLALCEGGPHGDIYDYFEDEEEWLSSVIYTAERNVEENNMGTLGKKYLKKYYDPYPVIFNQR